MAVATGSALAGVEDNGTVVVWGLAGDIPAVRTLGESGCGWRGGEGRKGAPSFDMAGAPA